MLITKFEAAKHIARWALQVWSKILADEKGPARAMNLILVRVHK
jgi:hypothetical protein